MKNMSSPNKTQNQELKYWVAINQVAGIGPVRFKKLFNHFHSMENAWQADFGQLTAAGLDPKAAQELLEKRAKIKPEDELQKIKEKNIGCLTLLDSDYPKLLKEIYAPPPLLYYLGTLDIKKDFLLAVVGTRKISGYGRAITEKITSELSFAGLTIVSGLALGVDALAHQAAVNVGGKTIGVLGSGLDLIYPASNQRLAQKIIDKNGCLLSEFPLGTPPYKSNFPQRNRIISGLSLGVLVIEANIKSGALITARYALEQNREVFAVPGDILRCGSDGPNQLIKDGAKMVSSANDILETLNLVAAKEFKEVQNLVAENETEETVLKILQAGPLHIDKLSQLSRLNISTLNSALAIMEMKGLVKNLGGQIFTKSR